MKCTGALSHLHVSTRGLWYGINGRNADNCPGHTAVLPVPGQRKLKPETAGERFASIRPLVASPATCAVPAMAPQASANATPDAAKPPQREQTNKIFLPLLPTTPAGENGRGGRSWERKKKKKSHTAESLANAGGANLEGIVPRGGLLFSHCMQMCSYSCLTRIRRVSAFSFKVSLHPPCKALDVSVNLQKKNKKKTT